MNNLNLYSCLIYVITGTVFLLWYYFAVIEPRGVKQVCQCTDEKIESIQLCMAFYIELCRGTCHFASHGIDQCDNTVCNGGVFRTCRNVRIERIFACMGYCYDNSPSSGRGNNFPRADSEVSEKGRSMLYRGKSDTGGSVWSLSYESGTGNLCGCSWAAAWVPGLAL